MLARLSAFVVWCLVAGAIVFWGLRLWVTPTRAPANAIAVVDTGSTQGDLSRLFGVEQAPVADAPPPESTRFKLLGVLAPRAGVDAPGAGVALVSVDGKPPRPYRAGARVEDRLMLQTVSLRSASFGPAGGPAAFTLEVPRMPDPATGTLNPVDASQMQVAPVAAPAPAGNTAPPPRMTQPALPAQPPVVTVNPGEGPVNTNGGPMGGPPPGNETPVRSRGGANGSGAQR